MSTQVEVVDEVHDAIVFRFNECDILLKIEPKHCMQCQSLFTAKLRDNYLVIKKVPD